MNEFIDFALLALAIGLYVFWRGVTALKAKEALAVKLDDYLASDHPEVLKKTLFLMFRESLKPFGMLRFLLGNIFVSEERRKKSKEFNEKIGIHEALSSLSDEQKQAYVVIFMSNIKVNMTLMPITYALVILCLAVSVVPRLLIGKSEKFANFVMRPKVDFAEDVSESVYNDRFA
ncbi:hypothetical protein AB4169_09600 [Vibrio lentus]